MPDVPDYRSAKHDGLQKTGQGGRTLLGIFSFYISTLSVICFVTICNFYILVLVFISNFIPLP